MLQVPSPNHQCLTCHMTFVDESAINAHCDTAHAPPSRTTSSRRAQPESECYICGKTFVDVSKRRRHCRTVHGLGGFKTFQCEFCPKHYKRRDTLYKHVSAVHSEMQPPRPQATHDTVTDAGHVCDVCGRKFSYKSVVETHLKTVHRIGDVEYFKCDICSKVFTRKSALKLHLQLVHGDGTKPFQCERCAKRFKRKDALNKHLSVIHDVGGVKAFPCNVCNKIFKRTGGLRAHLSTIHGIGNVKLFSCGACSRVFKWKHHLKKHLSKVHSEHQVSTHVIHAQRASPEQATVDPSTAPASPEHERQPCIT